MPRRGWVATVHISSTSEDWGTCCGTIHNSPVSVVKAYRRSAHELFAIKVFHQLPENTLYDLVSCDDSALLMPAFDHSNILKIIRCLFDEHGLAGLAMEFCGGGTIEALAACPKSKLTVAETNCLFKQIVRRVHSLHLHGIGHQNLRPENILLTLAGCVKIADFDNAKFAGPNQQCVVYATPPITDPYIAPEAYIGNDLDIAAVDAWALGVIYIFLRTSRLPWCTAKPLECQKYTKYLKERLDEGGFLPIQILGPVSITINFGIV